MQLARSRRQIAWGIGVSCALIGLGGPAAASIEATATFDAFDLADRGIQIWDADEIDEATIESVGIERMSQGTAWNEVHAECALAVSEGALVAPGEGDGCPTLWAMSPLVPHRLSLVLANEEDGEQQEATVVLMPHGPGEAAEPLRVDESMRLQLPEALSGSEVAYLRHEGTASLPIAVGWERVEVADELPVSPAGRAAALRPAYRIYSRQEGGLVAWASTPPTASTGTGTAAAASVPMAAALATMNAAAPPRASIECPPRREEFEDAVIVCARQVANTLELTAYGAPGQIMPPNRSIVVVVEHQWGQRVSVSMSGIPGTTLPAMKALPPGMVQRFAGFFAEGDAGGAQPPPVVPTIVRFPPRVAGSAPRLSVVVMDAEGSPVVENGMEFVVDRTFAGSLKIGVAGVMLALDENYRSETVRGSSQAEIVAVPRTPVDLDVVVGFTPYLETGGRSSLGCQHWYGCFAPYIGVGVVGTNGEGIDWFKSFHLGVEWELASSFGIGVTGVLRRVRRLSSGHEIGEPIDGDAPTDERWNFGAAVVLNLSPDFIKIISGGGGGGGSHHGQGGQ